MITQITTSPFGNHRSISTLDSKLSRSDLSRLL